MCTLRQSLQPCTTLFIGWTCHNESRINLLCWCTSVYMVWHQNIWRERVFSCPLYLADHTSVPLRTTNFLYRDRSLLLWALGRSVHPVLPRGTLFQLGYGTHHWHSNSSSVCSRRHCLRDCHRKRLSDSSLLFVRFEVSVYCYYYSFITHSSSLAPPTRLCFCLGLLSVCQQDYSISYGRIFMTLLEG